MTATDIDVRPARGEDSASLAALCAQLGYACALTEIERRLSRLVASDEAAVFVAAGERGRVVGFAQVGETDSLVAGRGASLQALVVDQGVRRCGVGRRLVEQAGLWARSRGHARLGVRSNVARSGAHDFYPSLGFERHKTQHCYRIALAP